MDEALLTHIGTTPIWAVGIWDRQRRCAAVEIVGNNRSAEKLQSIVERNVVS
jgi:hypothetical protein